MCETNFLRGVCRDPSPALVGQFALAPFAEFRKHPNPCAGQQLRGQRGAVCGLGACIDLGLSDHREVGVAMEAPKTGGGAPPEQEPQQRAPPESASTAAREQSCRAINEQPSANRGDRRDSRAS